jgi:hypothetical protein
VRIELVSFSSQSFISVEENLSSDNALHNRDIISGSHLSSLGKGAVKLVSPKPISQLKSFFVKIRHLLTERILRASQFFSKVRFDLLVLAVLFESLWSYYLWQWSCLVINQSWMFFSSITGYFIVFCVFGLFVSFEYMITLCFTYSKKS